MARAAGDISQWRFRLRETVRKVWVRVTAFAVLGALTAVAGFALKGMIPEDLPARIGADAIEAILQILASSMLAVTTFSLSILTAAYASAGTTATPRAVRLLVADPVSQTVLATFMGAFLFSLVSIILLKTELYGRSGRLVLFGVTLLVVLIVVVSLLRWIAQLSDLGRVGDTMGRVAGAARESFARRLAAPWLGANPLRGAPPPEARGITPDSVGHLQHCDMARLSGIAEEAGLLIYLCATPGDFLTPARPVMQVQPMHADPDAAESLRDRLLACLTIRPDRSFEQDPRFGLEILSEIGQRALSPAVNDPGTAIQAAGHMLDILVLWDEETVPVVEFPRLFLPSLSASELLDLAFLPLARDGASNFKLHLRLQEIAFSLSRISPLVYREAAVDLSRNMFREAETGVAQPTHRARLAEAVQEIIVY